MALTAQSALAAREVTLLLEGCVALMLIHGSADYAAAAAGAARHLVSLRYATDHVQNGRTASGA